MTLTPKLAQGSQEQINAEHVVRLHLTFAEQHNAMHQRRSIASPYVEGEIVGFSRSLNYIDQALRSFFTFLR